METFLVIQLELFKNNSGSIFPPKASRFLESQNIFNILEQMLLLFISLKLLWKDTGSLFLIPSPKARHPEKERRLETKQNNSLPSE